MNFPKLPVVQIWGEGQQIQTVFFDNGQHFRHFFVIGRLRIDVEEFAKIFISVLVRGKQLFS